MIKEKLICSFSFTAMKKRKQTVVTGDLKPMTDTLNQVIQDEIKPKLNVPTISQKSERKVSFQSEV